MDDNSAVFDESRPSGDIQGETPADSLASAFAAVSKSSRSWLAENHLGLYISATLKAVSSLAAAREDPNVSKLANFSTVDSACRPICEAEGSVILEGKRPYLQVRIVPCSNPS